MGACNATTLQRLHGSVFLLVQKQLWVILPEFLYTFGTNIARKSRNLEILISEWRYQRKSVKIEGLFYKSKAKYYWIICTDNSNLWWFSYLAILIMKNIFRKILKIKKSCHDWLANFFYSWNSWIDLFKKCQLLPPGVTSAEMFWTKIRKWRPLVVFHLD